MAGQGRAGGHIKSGQSKSRARRGQKAGHDGHCAIRISNCAGQGQNAGQGKKGQNKGSRFGQL